MEGSCGKRPSAGRNSQDPLDRALAELAPGQHGVVAGRQLVELGLSASATRSRVASGRLHRVHRGVFSVGHAGLTRNGRFMAAVLACGAHAVASHWSASVLLDLGLGVRRLVDVTAEGSRGRTRDGIRVHSGATLSAADVTVSTASPARRSPARCSTSPSTQRGARSIEPPTAEQRELLDISTLDDVLARANGRRGGTLLRSVLAEHR
ncbi:MAG: type IV toxin-antitoxin system AbiEi family antitoxin domain-containing protein, partial [Actinobacteria bacterium]|nr:type IV toxin-antitoxin system AbiEi family antitoxin domain-containing protein [Actinomycetota bacterium]